MPQVPHPPVIKALMEILQTNYQKSVWYDISSVTDL